MLEKIGWLGVGLSLGFLIWSVVLFLRTRRVGDVPPAYQPGAISNSLALCLIFFGLAVDLPPRWSVVQVGTAFILAVVSVLPTLRNMRRRTATLA